METNDRSMFLCHKESALIRYQIQRQGAKFYTFKQLIGSRRPSYRQKICCLVNCSFNQPLYHRSSLQEGRSSPRLFDQKLGNGCNSKVTRKYGNENVSLHSRYFVIDTINYTVVFPTRRGNMNKSVRG